jgi:hypothetical protein
MNKPWIVFEVHPYGKDKNDKVHSKHEFESDAIDTA